MALKTFLGMAILGGVAFLVSIFAVVGTLAFTGEVLNPRGWCMKLLLVGVAVCAIGIVGVGVLVILARS